MTNGEQPTTTMRCLQSTRDEYMLFKIQTKAKNIEKVLRRGLELLKKELEK